VAECNVHHLGTSGRLQ